MKKENLWESPKKQNFIFFNSTKEYFEFLKNNNLDLDFIVKESYASFDDIESEEDKYAFDNDIMLIYTDEAHPIAYSKNKTYIYPVFFERNITSFKRFAIKLFEKKLMNNTYNITIPNFILTDSLISILALLKKNRNYLVEDFDGNLNLTDEQIQILKDNCIELSIKKRFQPIEKISSKYAVNYYTLDDLKSNIDIIIELPTTKENLKNLVHVSEKSTIILKQSTTHKEDEVEYYNSIIQIFNILAKENHLFNIQINVTHRELFKNSKLIEQTPENINLLIDNNRYIYNIVEYKNEEKKLDNLVKPIKDSNLSPFEKYIAVYNLVKKFKPYKDHECNTDGTCEQGRVLKYVLEDNNEYIVCEGYAKLLKVLLDKVGISSQEIICLVDITKDEDYDPKIGTDRSGHDRNLVLINDPKYNIHGYYLADSTFDNITKYDMYLNSLMTFDRKKEARRNEFISNEDLLLDFHNFEEFQTKINYYLKLRIHENRYKTENENIQYAYIELYKSILKIIKEIDYQEYSYLFDKYNKYLTNYTLELSKLEKIASDMLTEYAEYIIPLSNNDVNFNTILLAASVVKRKLENYNDEQIQEWLQNTITYNEVVGEYTLPYIYDSNNPTEAYLVDKPIRKRK